MFMGKEPNKAGTKKNLRKEVALQMEMGLGQLKEVLGAKKFSNRVKKAARILTEGVSIKPKKEEAEQTQSPKAPVKKATKAAPAKTSEAPLKGAKRPAPVKKKPVRPVTAG